MVLALMEARPSGTGYAAVEPGAVDEWLCMVNITINPDNSQCQGMSK